MSSVALLTLPCVPYQGDAPTTQCPSMDSSAATESAFDEFLSLLVKCDEGVVEEPTKGDAWCPVRPSHATAARKLPRKETGKRKLARHRSVCAPPSRAGHARQVCRIISNNTYLRRMHLSPEQTIALMPSLASSLVPVVATKQRMRTRVKFKRLRHQFNLVNEAGQSWRIVCECMLSANKRQLHCRLGWGWAQFCRDNCAAVHDTVVLVRACSGSDDVLVKIKKSQRD